MKKPPVPPPPSPELSAATEPPEDAPHELYVRGWRGAALVNGLQMYLASPGLSVRDVWLSYRCDTRDPESPRIREVISWSSFELNATAQEWPKRRKALWVDVEKRVERSLQTRLVEREIADLDRLEEISNRVMLFIAGGETADGTNIDPVQPKSLEGLVAAYIKLVDAQTKKRQLVVDRTVAEIPEQDRADVIDAHLPDHDDELDDEEIAMLAHRIAEKRAAETDQVQEEDDGREGREESPPLHPGGGHGHSEGAETGEE